MSQNKCLVCLLDIIQEWVLYLVFSCHYTLILLLWKNLMYEASWLEFSFKWFTICLSQICNWDLISLLSYASMILYKFYGLKKKIDKNVWDIFIMLFFPKKIRFCYNPILFKWHYYVEIAHLNFLNDIRETTWHYRIWSWFYRTWSILKILQRYECFYIKSMKLHSTPFCKITCIFVISMILLGNGKLGVSWKGHEKCPYSFLFVFLGSSI